MSRIKPSYQSRAVVTGAGSGIGRAFALELYRRGGRVVCSDINTNTAQETADMINANGGSAIASKCNVAELSDVQALAQTAQHWFGAPANLLINNAGVGVGGQCIEEISMEDWRWITGINLWGVIHGCHAFLPALKAQQFGGIINVASAASFGATPLMGAYNTSKAAVVALSETLHAETAGSGIHVSVLCPTLVKTDVIKNSRLKIKPTSSFMSAEKAQLLMDRLGHSPESVVIKSLDGLDKNKMYVLPQIDARIAWLCKRMSPSNFIRASSFLNRKLYS